MEKPDCWVILKIDDETYGVFYKILAGWSGGYLHGNSWRMISGVKDYRENLEEGYVDFFGFSGSQYRCPLDYECLRMSTAGVFSKLKEEFEDKVDHIDFEDFKKEFKPVG